MLDVRPGWGNQPSSVTTISYEFRGHRGVIRREFKAESHFPIERYHRTTAANAHISVGQRFIRAKHDYRRPGPLVVSSQIRAIESAHQPPVEDSNALISEHLQFFSYDLYKHKIDMMAIDGTSALLISDAQRTLSTTTNSARFPEMDPRSPCGNGSEKRDEG
jgi:hypothetical protein